MLSKIKDNLALIVTGITLLGSIGAGYNSVVNIVNTLTGIDERMNSIEYEFNVLKDSTMVSNDIAILYEKIYQLEQVAYNAEYLENEGINIIKDYKVLITSSHPEYHSTKCWDTIYNFQSIGGNLMYLGGNGW